MTYSARVILDSVGPNGARLTTFELIIPRIVLAEFNTHRMFSRNSASSRAIPVEKMIERVGRTPFVPHYWGKNQKGMQADQELTEDEQHAACVEWQHAALDAIERAQALMKIGVHKQITNRLLEPFMWHTVVFTATELSNFIALRNNKMAQPEIQESARLLVEAYKASKPMELLAGEWHLPFVTNYELFLKVEDNILPNFRYWASTADAKPIDSLAVHWEALAKISAARCARTSYLTHEGKRAIEEDAALYEKLVTSGHMSPTEHPARAMSAAEWKHHATLEAGFWVEPKLRVPVGNFWGWQQFRKTIVNEHDFSLFQVAP